MRSLSAYLFALCITSAFIALGQDVVLVTGGTFTMGSNDAADNGASPTHAVTLGSFNMDKYEVTYEKWGDVYAWGLTHGYTDLVRGTNGYNPAGSNNPETGVNWYDIAKWCNARSEKEGLTPVYYTDNTRASVYRTGDIDLPIDAVKWTERGYRLPTEAEWEFAARGGNSSAGYLYSGSNTKGDVAWYGANSGSSTHTVGTKAANELGIYDLSGNIYEWCWDWYGNYVGTPQTDPKGPASGNGRAMRGGSFFYDDGSGRVAYRGVDFVISNNRSYGAYGFRCVQTIGTGSGIGRNSRMIPADFCVSQNYPNPFNPSTILQYSIPERSRVSISIYNTLGQMVSETVGETKDAGYYEHSFNASHLASGVYFYRIAAVSEQNEGRIYVDTKKMLLMR
jgi:formylglycine-generating enzyme required for sulfatase activity